MRFFSGIRSGSKKNKHSASEMYKKTLKAPDGEVREKTKDEIYKEALDARVAKMREQHMNGGRKEFRLPGTKVDDTQKEFSENARKMMYMLAQKKMNQEKKIELKKQLAFEKEQKRKKKKLAYEQAKAKAEAEAAATSANSSYFFGGGSDDKKDGWGW